MAHLAEIKPNAFVVNLPEFEEGQLAKHKKKSTKDTKEAQVSKKKTKPTEDAQLSEKTQSVEAPPVSVEARPAEVEASEEIKPAEIPEAKEESRPAELPQASEESRPAEATQVDEEPPAVEAEQAPRVDEVAPAPEAAPEVAGGVVVLKDTRVSYDEETRLYAIEHKNAFYDDSPDLDRIMRVVRGLMPDVTDKELNALKNL